MTVENFLNNCISCGICQSACPFLEQYGTPEIIIKEKPSLSFLCTTCRACDSFCPQYLEPSNALLETKQKLVKERNIPESVKIALNSSRGFVNRGHSFPFSHYPDTDTVFWPGCSLAGSNPKIVKKILSILNKSLNKKVGLALDCCSDPLYQMGDSESVEKITEDIRYRFKKHGINYVITGCVNCKKIFSLHFPEIRTEHILEVIPKDYINIEKLKNDKLFIHHPCPSFRFRKIHENLKDFYIDSNKISEINNPSCCGLGGGLSSIDKELSDKFTERIFEKSEDSKIITYCMGCKNNFLKKNRKTYHFLEFIPDIKAITKPVSSKKKWLNRFLLSMNQMLNAKKMVMALAVVALIFLATKLRQKGVITPESIFGFIQRYKITAPLFFILIYAVGPSLFIPSLPLTLGAGFLWGPFWGVVFSITGATLGASIAFLISRYILGDTLKEKFSYSRWAWLKEKVERHGWKAVAFSRIVPIFPFPVLNYLFGITPIPFLHYLWSTFVFMLPACIAYVAFGSSMGELILKGNIKGLVIGILIATIAMLLPLALKPFIKKVFPKKDE
jgi:uncharacterized membrane protein YdjX (TVP38/TMEM64 family)/Fe-S oxidoreductase